MAKNESWSLEKIKDGLTKFHSEHGHYPTSSEFDEYPYLPRTKTIERRFGGLVAFRKQLNLDADSDLRTGAHSSERAFTINKRAHAMEQKVYEFLVGRFGKEFVHREYFFSDDHRTRADFFVYDAQDGFCVDVFYPNSVRNLTGCLNIKLKKYVRSGDLMPYRIIFLQMNNSITQDQLNEIVEKKDRKLKQDQSLMEWESFQAFCLKRKSRK
jgi:hypothetical protein